MALSIDASGNLFAIGNDILARRIFPFLSMEVLGKIDMALTNHALRPHFLKIYPLLSHIEHLRRGLDARQLSWITNRSITLEYVHFVSSVPIDELVSMLKQLKKSNIKQIDMSSYGESTTESLFYQLFDICGQVHTLNLSGCKNVSKNVIQRMSIWCPSLTSLDLSDCDLAKTASALAQMGFPSLTTLSLARSSPGKKGNNMLKHTAIRSLAVGVPWIQSLDLSCCDNIRDGVLASVAKVYPALTSLNIRGCDKITDASIRILAQSCSGLLHIEFGVGIDCSGKVTDSSIIALSHNCPNLLSVGMSRCYNITDSAAIVLGKGCPMLTSVDFTYCTRLTNEGVIALVTGCPRLLKVHLSKCAKLTGVAVTALSQFCPALSTLSLHSCARITNVSLIALVKGCRGLTFLDVTNCTQLTDDSFLAVAKNCSQLNALHMSGCESASSVAVEAAVLACPLLVTLVANGLHDILVKMVNEEKIVQSRRNSLLSS